MSMTCVGCGNFDLPNEGGHCYMFRHAPTDGFCGQHTEVQRVVATSPTLIKIALSAAVLSVINKGRT